MPRHLILAFNNVMERSRISLLILILGFMLSLALVVIFTIRGLHAVPSRRMGEPIRPWMSVPYIARSYQVPASALFQSLGLPENLRDRRPIAMIARDKHRPVQEIILIIYQAIRENNPAFIPPTPAFPIPTGSAP